MNKDLKILVTGAYGQLGSDCVRELKERGYKNILAVDRVELDIIDKEAVFDLIIDYRPDVIMHNAAWTAIDKAEQYPFAAYEVNALGSKYIAEAAKEVGAKMFYISTDYVFDGSNPNELDVDAPKNGTSIYGKTKSIGEDNVMKTIDKYFIIRISWVFGLGGNNFVKKKLKAASSGTPIYVTNDQIGSPTFTYDLSKLMCDMMETEKYGVYHATNEGECSQYELIKYVFDLAGVKTPLIGVSTEEYKKYVPAEENHPVKNRLSKASLTRAGFSLLPPWKDAAERFTKEYLKMKR